MRAIARGALLALLGCIWGVGPARAQGDTLRVTLREARRLALETNPAFLADEQVREIAAGRLRQARTYPYNPEIEIEAPAPLSGGVVAYDAWLWQEMEWAGQRGLRIGTAEAGAVAAEGVAADAARRLLAETGVAFYEALAARRRLAVAEDVLDLNTRLLEAVRTQVAEGDISVMDANFAEIEAGRTRALVLATRQRAATTALALGRLLAQPAHRVVLPVAGVEALPSAAELVTDSLLRQALARRPDLAAREAELRRAEMAERLTRRSAVPNVRVGGALMRDPVRGATSWGVGIGLPLPLFDRRQGEAATNAARTRRAALALAAIELDVRTDVDRAVRAYRLAAEEARIFEEDVLEPARENQRMLGTAYRAGRIGLTDLVLLRNQLVDAELGYWDAWLRLRAAWVELQSVSGHLTRGIVEENGYDKDE